MSERFIFRQLLALTCSLSRSFIHNDFPNQTRTLSCAGLFVSPGRKNNDTRGRIWLIDSSGTYAVRGLCIGGGWLPKGSSGDISGSTMSHRKISNHVNRMIAKLDWTSMSTTNAIDKLVELLSQQENSEGNGVSKTESITPPLPLLPEFSRLEAVVVDSANRKMKRLKINMHGLNR